MYTNDRNAYRLAFHQAWDKHVNNQIVDSLETQLIQIILLHPEYQSLIEQTPAQLAQDYSEQDNPFLHMSLHLAIQEQIDSNRPAGIQLIYQQLIQKTANQHDVLHVMMDCLAETLWEAQQSGALPQEEKYLTRLKVIIK